MICTELFDFIKAHKGDDPNKLRLKYHGSPQPWMPLALNHLEAAKKCTRKFGDLMPELIGTTVSVEQATSCTVAKLHGHISQTLAGTGGAILDMTCGLGIDLKAITRALAPDTHATGVELNPTLAETTAYNFRHDTNVEIICADSVKWLEESGKRFRLIFIDPARRDASGKRLYNIHDCAPDVAEILPLLRAHTDTLIVKLSPMLDVAQTLRDLPCTQLHVVDEGGDCRELLAVVDFTSIATIAPDDVPVTIHSLPQSTLTFTRRQETHATPAYGTPKSGQWLFEPSPAAMKAAPFALLSGDKGLVKLHPNTHLYFADTPASELPGRWHRISEVIPFTSSTARDFKQRRLSADVATRNFPMQAAELATRLRIAPGGTHRLMGATVHDGSRILILMSK